MAKILYKIGDWAYRKAKQVILTWVMIIVLAIITTVTMGIKFSGGFSIPGTESEKAGDVLKEAFSKGDSSNEKTSTIKLIFKVQNEKTLDDSSVKDAINKTLEKIQENDTSVIAVADPYKMYTISNDRKIGYTDITYNVAGDKVTEESKDNVLENIKLTKDAGIQTELGGSVEFTKLEIGGVADVVGVFIAFLVLVVTFGLFLAAGLPILTALIGLIIGLTAIFIGSNFIDMSSFTLSLAAMIGLAVGIDYALFIISRYRQNISEGHDFREASAKAMATAGSAVLFAGITVIIALCGLSLVGVPFLGTMGMAAAVVVLVAVLVSLTITPAVISLAGERISPSKKNRIFKMMKTKKKKDKSNFWGKIVTKHPIITVISVLVITAVVSSSALNLQLGLPDNGMKGKDTTERKGYDILAEGFGKGFNGPLIVVADASKTDGDTLKVIQDSLGGLKDISDIASISPVIPNETGKVAMVNVIPKSGPNDKETKELVENIRLKGKEIKEDKNVEIMVTGATAVNIDISNKLSDAIPKFTAVIVGLAIALMILVFRSILVPLKAVLGFIMTLVATLGFAVLVLQEGHMASLFKIQASGPILCFMPILATGILFGLAMDYEVFLVSRMREDFNKTGEAEEAVVSGINHSGTVVTAAGLIMVSVFASFIFNNDLIIKSMGLSLAFGVLFDAFVIRMTFVPAVMTLLGKSAWYIPRWLDKILPKIDVEGESLEVYKDNNFMR